MFKDGNQSMEQSQSPVLSSEEEFFVRQFLLLTGREERLDRKPIVEPTQLGGIRAVVPHLKESTQAGTDDRGKCDLFNRLLLSMGIKPADFSFFETVFGNVDFSKENAVEERVKKFRCLCMLEYGSFRFGYKVLKFGGDSERRQSLRDLWSKYFPDPTEVTKRVGLFKAKPAAVGLYEIPPTQLFVLGYLASEQAKKVNGARQQLSTILDDAITSPAKDTSALSRIAKKHGVEAFGAFVATAGIPGTEKLLYPKLHAPGVPYNQILIDAKEACKVVDEGALEEAQRQGKQNSETYFAMHDVEVYVATSMRDPLHFTTNHSFVTQLFKQGELKDWKLRYFDPTQSYLPDRIQKGLTECLMIKRADVTIYNAQEADTFGKDAEAAVALAQGKPVVVYVARLFGGDPSFNTLYKAIDSAPRMTLKELVDSMKDLGYLTAQDVPVLSAPEKTKSDCIDLVVRQQSEKLMKQLNPSEVEGELISQGYEPPQTGLIGFAVERISKLERRALMFLEIHPLSLQTSPIDGVARGVIVTRSVRTTAKILQGLLVGTLEYEIAEPGENSILVEKITRSPVRVVAKNPILTTAFWSEFSREKIREAKFT